MQNGTGLVVYADGSTNQSTYSCLIRILSQSGEELVLESSSATLSVVTLRPSLGNFVILNSL